MSSELSVVGKRLPKPDAPQKATGAAPFGADITLPGLLVGKILRSPHAHARILRIDATKARELDGVVAVITKDDVPRVSFNIAILQHHMVPPAFRGEPMDQHIFNDKARHVGDPIAAVAAIDEGIAEKALELIEVEYEKLPAVFDPIEAMKPEAPKLHDSAANNIAAHSPFPFSKGDAEQGFQEADYIVEETFRTSNQYHCPIEPTVCAASFDSAGRLTVWSPCQIIHPARRLVGDLFDLPEGMVRWLTPHIGGSFGHKQSLTAEPICVALAIRSGRPVKIEATRDEEVAAYESRERVVQTARIGVKGDGAITAMQTQVVADAGAYLTHSSVTAFINMRGFLGLYRCPNIDGEAHIVYTNNPTAGGMRGYGDPGASFALEQVIDMAAEKIGMDPLEFRLRNLKETGEPSIIPDIPIENSALPECIRLGAEKIGWNEENLKERENKRCRSIGMACAVHNTSTYPVAVEHSGAFIKLNADGSANLAVGSCELGQGILGSLAQIAAEELGLSAEDIHIVAGDTDLTPFDSGTHASRSTYVTGNSVLRAAREVKGQILERAAKVLKVPVDDLIIKRRQIHVGTAPERKIPIAEIAHNAIYNFEGECQSISARCSFEAGNVSPSFCAVFTSLEIDPETGKIQVLKIVSAADVGRAINPMTVEGQLEGAAIQGLGYALTEKLTVSEEEGLLTSDWREAYKIPSTLDLPQIEIVLVEQPVPSGPFGAKGVGEIGVVGIAPAVANAVYNALGIRAKELPIMPEEILALLNGYRDTGK